MKNIPNIKHIVFNKTFLFWFFIYAAILCYNDMEILTAFICSFIFNTLVSYLNYYIWGHTD